MSHADMKKENWKAIAGFEDKYEVSDLGNVRSLPRAIDCNGSIWNHPGGPLTPKVKEGGELEITFSLDGKKKRSLLRVIVLEAFTGPRPKKRIAAHINGDITDCRLSNLEWRPTIMRRRPKDAPRLASGVMI